MQNVNINNEFSKLSYNELYFFLMDLRNFYLKVSPSLNLKEEVTFGIEIEADYVNPKDLYFYALSKKINFFNYAVIDPILFNDKIYTNKRLLKNWNIDKETDPKTAVEIISPILKDTPKTWKELFVVCKLLQDRKAQITEKVGAHIHIGAHLMKDLNSWVNLIKLWTLYEHIIFRFSYGENLNYRSYILEYAGPIRNKVMNNIEKVSEVNYISSLLTLLGIKNSQSDSLDLHRILYFFKNVYVKNNTIEVRCPNGTISPEVWQNNINFFIKLILYSTSENFDSDYINFHLKKLEEKYNTINNYNRLDLTNALKLCDMIFDNNLDKINFLKQYYKNGLESDNFEDKVKLVL